MSKVRSTEIAFLEQSVRNDLQRFRSDVTQLRRSMHSAVTSPIMFGFALAGGFFLARRRSSEERRAERRRRRPRPGTMLQGFVRFIQKVLVPLFVAEGLAEGTVSGFTEDTETH